MKAIMYHYIRPNDPRFPYFRHLHLDDFVKQIEYFGNEYGFVSRKDFKASLSSTEPAKGVVLTFDDGFKDHYRYVLPEMLQRGLWGIFYIPTFPFITGKLLHVHRVHLLLGKYGGHVIKDALMKIVTDDMMSQHNEAFQTETYKMQKNSASTNYVKRLLNYFIDFKCGQNIMDELMSSHFSNENDLVRDFYMTKTELAHMHQSGMVIGSHTVNHPVMSKLMLKEQEEEIVSSFQTIESITGKQDLKTFCYPYGGFHTFTDQTEELLEKNTCLFAFNVEPRNIDQKDLACRRQALPRLDCNLFPHGSPWPCTDSDSEGKSS